MTEDDIRRNNIVQSAIIFLCHSIYLWTLGLMSVLKTDEIVLLLVQYDVFAL